MGAYLFKGECGQATDLISSMAPSLSPPRLCAAGQQMHPVVEQFPALKLRGLPEFQGTYAEDTLWGTYRSGQYLGTLHCCTCAACHYWEWAYLCVLAPDTLPQLPVLCSPHELLSLSCHN